MKHVFIIILGFFLLNSCIKKDENPTIFEGKIVYEDDGSPAAGAGIGISSVIKSPPLTGARSGPSQGATVDETGIFRIEFPYNEEIQSFGIITSFVASDGTVLAVYGSGNGLDCSPHTCTNFQPGQTHTDLLLKVKRP